MKVIVDTNIVFSALLNTDNQFADLLINSGGNIEFYSCYLLREEIHRHKEKLVAISGMSISQIETAEYQIFRLIRLISEDQIPFPIWKTCIPLVREVDMDDLPFVALTEYIQGFLWTGDKKLIKELESKGWNNLITSKQLLDLRSR